jgi:hypothetical protein
VNSLSFPVSVFLYQGPLTTVLWGIVRKRQFWSDNDRKLAEVSFDFFLNFTSAYKHNRQRFLIQKNGKHGKLKEFTGKWKPLRRRDAWL